MSWRDQASCLDRDPALWDFDDPDAWREGAAICAAHCPVRAACLAAALKEEEGESEHGRAMIRGGLTPKQRRRLSKGLPIGDARARPAQPPGPLAPKPSKFQRMTDDESRLAHNRFNAGARDAETRAGERKYQRERARIYRAARKAAVAS